jgi:hypothetical protein
MKPHEILACAALAALTGCAAATDRVLARNATTAFDTICFAPDGAQGRAQAETLRFRRIDTEAGSTPRRASSSWGTARAN